MNRLVCCVALFVLVAQSSATKFSDCGSSGQVSKVEVSNCPDSADKCMLTRGTKPSLGITFTSKTTSNSVKAVVHGVISGVPLPFPLPKSKTDGCKFGVTCPMTPNQTFNYNNAIDVKTSYPPLGVTVRWELQDDNGADIVCVEIPCEIN